MLRLLLEIVIALALSIVVITLAGVGHYIVIGAVIAAVAAAAIYATNGLINNQDSAPAGIWILMTLVLCALLGAMWPALPLIFLYERGKTKRHLAKPINVVDGGAVTPPPDKEPKIAP